MNNIIQHINFQGFTRILGEGSLQKFQQGYTNKPVCLLFIAQWSIPSRLVHKRLRKASCDKKKIGLADVDLVDNIELCQKFKVEKVPHCFVLQKGQIIMQFIGLDIQKLNQAVGKYAKLPEDEQNKLKIIEKCPNNHKLQMKYQLPYPPYIDNYVYCNQCKKIDKCSQNNSILHCGECDYDVCQMCYKHQLNL